MNLIIIGGYIFWFLIVLTCTIGVFLMLGKVLLWLFTKYQDLRSEVKVVGNAVSTMGSISYYDRCRIRRDKVKKKRIQLDTKISRFA